MSAMASQITGVSIVCSTVCCGVDQRKHQSSASLAFVMGIRRWPVNSPHKGQVVNGGYPSQRPSNTENVSIWWCHHVMKSTKLFVILQICGISVLLPEALLAYGYCHRLCLCLCVSVCLSTFACPDDNSSHVPARITWFGRKDAKLFCLRSLLFWGLIELDLPCQVWLHFKILFICIAFASLKYLWDMQKRSLLNYSTSHMAPHTFWFLYMHAERVVPWTV